MNVIVDSCFWYALFDSSDPYHTQALQIENKLRDVKFIVPFPTLYEVINTRFSKKDSLDRFRRQISSPECVLIPDEKYKDDVLRATFFFSLEKQRPISLVDMIIRIMMEDVNLQIRGLLTFNVGDFVDVCLKKKLK